MSPRARKDSHYWMTQVVTDVTREVRADIGHNVLDSSFCSQSWNMRDPLIIELTFFKVGPLFNALFIAVLIPSTVFFVCLFSVGSECFLWN